MNEAEVLAQEGMDRAVNATDPRWLGLCRWTVEQFAARGTPFTTDDVLLFMAELGVDSREKRGLGGLVRSMARDNIIRPTGRWVNGTRPQSHGRPMREWVCAEPLETCR